MHRSIADIFSAIPFYAIDIACERVYVEKLPSIASGLLEGEEADALTG